MLNKFKFVDQGKSFYAERPDRKNALGLHLCHVFTPFFLNILFSGGGPCSEEVSTISEKACDILGENSPTI
jgi:hypothetical protein